MRLKAIGKPSHVQAADQAHDDEHGLGGEVRTDRR